MDDPHEEVHSPVDAPGTENAGRVRREGQSRHVQSAVRAHFTEGRRE